MWQRRKKPLKSNKWYYADNPFYWAGYGLPNCTAYAWGRFGEIMGRKPKLSTSNAENWWSHTSDGYDRGQAPRPGAVICWRKGRAGDGSDGAGHVAVVEQINKDGSIICSMSGWGCSSTMWRQKINRRRFFGSAYTFQGFIYNPGAGKSAYPMYLPSHDISRDESTKYRTELWQTFLSWCGYGADIDGIFGRDTEGMTKRFQAEHSLKPDGVVGRLTRAKARKVRR